MNLKPYAKAVVAFIVTYIGGLVTMVTSGIIIDGKALLLALGMAIVTTYGVYQTKNAPVK